MASAKQILAKAKLRQRKLPICMDGELVDEYEEAQEALAEAKERAKAEDSLAGSGEVRDIEARLEDLRTRMTESTIVFVVQAVGNKRWSELLGEHPPRKGNTRDEVMLGFNEDTMARVLIVEGLISPKLTAEEKDMLLDEQLSEGQYKDLANAAYGANRKGSVSVPLPSAASRTAPSTGAE